MEQRIAPSVQLEAELEELPSGGVGDGERLVEVGRLGARPVLQRALEDEVEAFLGRARSAARWRGPGALASQPDPRAGGTPRLTPTVE